MPPDFNYRPEFQNQTIVLATLGSGTLSVTGIRRQIFFASQREGTLTTLENSDGVIPYSITRSVQEGDILSVRWEASSLFVPRSDGYASRSQRTGYFLINNASAGIAANSENWFFEQGTYLDSNINDGVFRIYENYTWERSELIFSIPEAEEQCDIAITVDPIYRDRDYFCMSFGEYGQLMNRLANLPNLIATTNNLLRIN